MPDFSSAGVFSTPKTAADKAFIIAALIKIGRHVQRRDSLIKQANALNPAYLVKAASTNTNKQERLKLAAICAEILREEKQIEKLANPWLKGLGILGGITGYELARPYVAKGLNTAYDYGSYPFRSAYNWMWPKKKEELPPEDYTNTYFPRGFRPRAASK